MKKIPIAFFMACIIYVSCNKPLPDYSGQPFAYTTSGDTDISLPANDMAPFYTTLSLLSGNPANEPVTVSFKGMPAGVSLTTDSLSFRLNYAFADSLVAHNAAQGVYAMQAIFRNSSAGTQTVNFNLTITPPLNRVALLCGSYYPSNTCGPYIYVSCTIDSVPGVPNEVMFVDRVAANYTAPSVYDTSYGVVDCCTNTFTIPSQKVPGATIAGSGSFGKGSVSISKTVTSDTSSLTCNYILSN